MAQLAGRGGAGIVGSGPLNLLLSNSGAQWATLLGMGTYLYNPDTFVKSMRTILTGDKDAILLGGPHQWGNNHHSDRTVSTAGTSSSVPIIIHTSSSDTSRSSNSIMGTSILTTIIFYTIGAGCVWVSYTVCTSILPEYVSELMPVTRKVFNQTTKNLATSLFHVKEAMIKQIQFVMSKQDELGMKQDDTHRDVKDIQEDMKYVRSDLSGVMDGVDRCEASVEASQRLQAYTARGVKLLVAAVATVLPRDENYQILRELEKYARDGEPFRHQLMMDRSPSPPPVSTNHGGNSCVSQVVVQQQPPLPHYIPPLTVNDEPPENEHPRQQYHQLPPPQLSNSSQQQHAQYTTLPAPIPKPLLPHRDNNNNHEQCDGNQSEIDFLAMIRDGTLVVQRP